MNASHYTIPIPEMYIWMTQDSSNRAVLFSRYVRAYVKRNYPEMAFVKISGMYAICTRSEG